MACRRMEFAGSWYPRSAEDCRHSIEAMLADSPKLPAGSVACHGLAPHAGWMFSGKLAARVFQALAKARPADVIVVLGGHLRRDDPLIAMTEDEWMTPLGTFVLHQGFRRTLESFPHVVRESAAENESDNSIELQLPLARFAFPSAELLTIRVPPSATALELGRRLAEYAQDSGLKLVVVASTDLTHYGPAYSFEPRGRGPAAVRWVQEENDPQFIRAVESRSGEAILDTARRQRNACSSGAAAALGELARMQGLSFRELGYATSLDADPAVFPNFVGYVAGVFLADAGSPGAS